MKKHLLVFALLIGGVVGLGGCKSNNKVTTLSTPTNLVVENNFISFDEVDNASYYLINYDGNTFKVKPTNNGEIIFDANKIFTESKIYEIKVKALGSKKFADSSYTSLVKYSTIQDIDAPEKLSIYGKILSWSAVDDINFYTVKVTYPNGKIGLYEYNSTNFDFSPILKDVGIYNFSVKAGFKNEENDYSYSLPYTYTKKHAEPSNLNLEYNSQQDKLYLHFIADSCYGFNININNKNYFLKYDFVENYSLETNYKNYYILDLFKFLADQDNFVETNSYTVTVQALSGISENYIDSEVSQETTINLSKVLSSPLVSMTNSSDLSVLSWKSVDNATSYTIYKNFEIYARVEKNVNSITFKKDDIANDYFSVKAEGVGKFISSSMSNVVATSPVASAGALSGTFDNSTSILSWTNTGAEKYVLEIINEFACKTYEFDATVKSFNFEENGFNYANYTAKVYALTSAGKISSKSININYTKKLPAITNAQVGSSSSMYSVTFDTVEDAFGYAVKIIDISSQTENNIDYIFNTNQINLTDYVLSYGEFKIYLKAVAKPNLNILDSDFVEVGDIKHLLKLDSPNITVEDINGKYILKFDEIENAQNYTIKVNQIVVNISDYISTGYDLTNYLTEAQKYYVSVIANANPDDKHITSSNETSIAVDRYIQLSTINKDDMEVQSRDGKYYLNLKYQQTHVANYDIRIKNVSTGKEDKFNIETVPYDITNYLANKGKYNIYIKALPKEDSEYLYLASAESGNPYVIDKREANLFAVNNINLKREGDTFTVSWDLVENANYYFVQLYHTSNRGVVKILTQESVTSNSVELTKYFAQEGNYQVYVKAVADGWISSGVQQSETLNHQMLTVADYKRNTVFINGENYSHYIESFEQLKNLIWHYYLYNDINLAFDNNVKFMLKIDDAQTVSDEPIDDGERVANSSEIIQTLYQQYRGNNEAVAYGTSLDILKELIILGYTDVENSIKINSVLNSYTEIMAYTNANLISNINSANLPYYEFSFENALNNDKLESLENNKETYNFFNQKQNTLSSDKRADNYVFAIDSLDKIDVYNSEQLYMVVQHDKAPNFAINGTVAETVYNNARAILREIITDNMNDYQKVEAIYDWLIENVHYIMNFDATMGVSPVWSSLTTENKVLGNYKYNYLEGVFIVDEGKIREATSSGISKAFVLMCKIEGIDAIKVNGTRNLDNVNRVYSSWNKVELDYNINDTDNSKQWYTIDIVSSYLMDSTMYIQENLVPVYYQLPSHKFFLVTDSFVDDAGIIETSATQKVTSSTNANYYYTQTKFISSDLKVIFAKYSESDYNTPEEYIRAILKYMANEVNKKHNVFIAIDMADSNNATNGAKNMSNHIVRAGLSSLVKFSSKAEGSVLYIAMAPNK